MNECNAFENINFMLKFKSELKPTKVDNFEYCTWIIYIICLLNMKQILSLCVLRLHKLKFENLLERLQES